MSAEKSCRPQILAYCVPMCTYMYICIRVYVCIFAYVYMYVYTSTRVYECIYFNTKQHINTNDNRPKLQTSDPRPECAWGGLYVWGGVYTWGGVYGGPYRSRVSIEIGYYQKPLSSRYFYSIKLVFFLQRRPKILGPRN